jgi:hypothetical protein
MSWPSDKGLTPEEQAVHFFSGGALFLIFFERPFFLGTEAAV